MKIVYRAMWWVVGFFVSIPILYWSRSLPPIVSLSLLLVFVCAGMVGGAKNIGEWIDKQRHEAEGEQR